jgi:hypothetical protein
MRANQISVGEGGAHEEALTDEDRRTTAKIKFGTGKGRNKYTEVDWIPRDCHHPINCSGLVRKAIAEANAMIDGGGPHPAAAAVGRRSGRRLVHWPRKRAPARWRALADGLVGWVRLARPAPMALGRQDPDPFEAQVAKRAGL